MSLYRPGSNVDVFPQGSCWHDHRPDLIPTCTLRAHHDPNINNYVTLKRCSTAALKFSPAHSVLRPYHSRSLPVHSCFSASSSQSSKVRKPPFVDSPRSHRPALRLDGNPLPRPWWMQSPTYIPTTYALHCITHVAYFTNTFFLLFLFLFPPAIVGGW